MRYLTLIGVVTVAFFVVYGIFAWIDRNKKRKSKTKTVDRKTIAYQPMWTSYSYETKKEKPEFDEFETTEKMDRK